MDRGLPVSLMPTSRVVQSTGIDLSILDDGERKKLVECQAVGTGYIEAGVRELNGRNARAGSKTRKQATADRNARFSTMTQRIKRRVKGGTASEGSVQPTPGQIANAGGLEEDSDMPLAGMHAHACLCSCVSCLPTYAPHGRNLHRTSPPAITPTLP
jgi:hypothetical protein